MKNSGRSWRNSCPMRKNGGARPMSFRPASAGASVSIGCERPCAISRARSACAGKFQGTSMREICLDTETTGLEPGEGHRMVELACVELINLMPTGRELHLHFDPERDMPAEAEAVHGLSREFLTGKPKFVELADVFLDFMQDSRLV